jgi:hypothetical protein
MSEEDDPLPVWVWVILVVAALVVILPPVLTVYARWWSYWFGEPLLPRVP